MKGLGFYEVLLIEDDREDAFLIEEKLSGIKTCNFSIHRAENLRSARQLASKHRFDVILSDLGLPDGQGMETLRSILQFAPAVPVLVLTGLYDVERGAMAVENGAQDYLVKGEIDHGRLEKAICYAIGRNKLEEDLRAGENRVRTLFQNSPEANFIIDSNGNIQDANRKAEALSGKEIQDLKSSNIFDLGLIPPDQRIKAREALEKASKGKKASPMEFRFSQEDGRETFVSIRLVPFDVHGETSVFISAADITEKKLAEIRERKYLNNMQLLARASIEMIKFSENDQVLKYICGQLLNLTGPKGMVISSDIDDDLIEYSVKFVKSKSKTIAYAEKLLKKKLTRISGKVAGEYREKLGTSRLFQAETDLELLTGGAIGQKASRVLEKYLELQAVYMISLVRGGKIYGTIGIVSDLILDEGTRHLVEAFINQASIVLERISYQKKFLESEERYKILFENSPLGMSMIGSDDRIIAWNQQIIEIFKTHDIPASTIDLPSLYRNPADREPLLEAFRNREEIKDREVEFVKPDGEVFIGNLSVVPVNYLGETCRLTVVSDVTDHRRDQEEKKKLYKAIEQSPSMVLITDAMGVIEYVNPSFCHTTGFSEEEAYGKRPMDVLKPGNSKDSIYQDMWLALSAGTPWRGIVQNKNREGRLFWSELKIFPIKDQKQNVTHFVGIVEDITESKMAEEELIRAKDQAEESDRLKTSFLSNLSHEIRTPMNAILGFSGLLDSSEYDPEKKKEFIRIIQSRSQELLKIITNLVDMSKIESGIVGTQLADIKVSELITSVFNSHKDHSRSDVKFKLEIAEDLAGVELYTDQKHLSRILSNLVDNAQKYTDKGSITMGCRKDKRECVFYVHDTGIGISENKARVIFQRFMQEEAVDVEARGGNGLGLAIAKKTWPRYWKAASGSSLTREGDLPSMWPSRWRDEPSLDRTTLENMP